MKDFWENNNVKDFLFSDIFGVDEVIRKLGNYLPEEQKEFKIQRRYFTVIQTGENSSIEEDISKEEYEENKESSNCFTKLNYEDFEEKFLLNDFLNFLHNNVFVSETAEQDGFFNFTTNYINSSPNIIQSKIRLRSILQILKGCSSELNSLKNSIELNDIQKQVIIAYSKQYLTFRESLLNYYKDILTTNTGNAPSTNDLQEAQNSFPDIFKSGTTYNQFISYTEKHIIDPYTDYSYLFQNLLNKELIHKTAHKDFFLWLWNNDFLSEKRYEEFFETGFFKSLTKSYSVQRNNNFNNLFS